MRVVSADHALPLCARRPDCPKVIDGIDKVSRRTCLKVAGSDGAPNDAPASDEQAAAFVRSVLARVLKHVPQRLRVDRHERPASSVSRHRFADSNTWSIGLPDARFALKSDKTAMSASSAAPTSSGLVAQTSFQMPAGLDASRVVSASPLPLN